MTRLEAHYHCKECDLDWQQFWEKGEDGWPTYKQMKATNPDCRDCKSSVSPHCLFLKRNEP